MKVAAYRSEKHSKTNWLEDNGGNKLNIMRADDIGGEGTFLRHDFEGFEVKTVKPVLVGGISKE